MFFRLLTIKQIHMKIIVTTSFLFFNLIAFAQVSKNIITEHFTNTVCSICPTKNSQLSNNLSNNPNVLRISYHPSSPYSSCILNQYNVSGNDTKTNSYNVYGSTPRIVIQGEVQSPSVNFSSSTLFDNYKDELTYLNLTLSLDTVSVLDSVKVRVVTHLVSPITNGVSSHNLYVALAEDTVFYNAPNGESSHKNVFRNSFNGNSGASIDLSSLLVGDSIVKEYVIGKDTEWNMSRVFAYALIQDPSNKDVKQAGSSSRIFENQFTSIGNSESELVDVSITQSVNGLSLNSKGFKNDSFYKIYTINGKLIKQGRHLNNVSFIETTEFPSSLYILKLEGLNNTVTKKFLKVK